MTDPRDLDVLELAGVISEHIDEEWLPYVAELERRYFQEWARLTLERAAFAHKAAEANELRRDAA